MIHFFLSFILISFFVGKTHARVFDFSKETLSSYLIATGGISNASRSLYENSGADLGYSERVGYNFSGEIGFAFTGGRVNTRLGIEFLLPQQIEAEGAATPGSTLSNLESEALIAIPTIAFEFILHQTPTFRIMSGFGLGYASLTAKNSHTLTTAGQAATGLQDFNESIEGSTFGGHFFGGLEALMTDNVAVTLGAGYRIYEFDELEYSEDATTFIGDVKKGEPVLDNEGAARKLNMSGFYMSIGLRFYISL